MQQMQDERETLESGFGKIDGRLNTNGFYAGTVVNVRGEAHGLARQVSHRFIAGRPVEYISTRPLTDGECRFIYDARYIDETTTTIHELPLGQIIESADIESLLTDVSPQSVILVNTINGLARKTNGTTFTDCLLSVKQAVEEVNGLGVFLSYTDDEDKFQMNKASDLSEVVARIGTQEVSDDILSYIQLDRLAPGQKTSDGSHKFTFQREEELSLDSKNALDA